ncbi:hypothetical protein NX059_011458 [Plenodomus lindquistii]|nr:hypothetical protein NX059_011458 [Plenodomus lindquistii]
MLCSVCMGMSQDLDANQSHIFPHHFTLQSLQLAKEAGCYICTEIAEDIEEEPDPNELDEKHERPLLWHMHHGTDLQIYVAHGKGFKLGRWRFTAVDSSSLPFAPSPHDTPRPSTKFYEQGEINA